MTCDRAMDLLMEETHGEPTPLMDSALLRLHLLHCERCAAEAKPLRAAMDLMRTGFLPRTGILPQSPNLGDAIMAAVHREVAAQAARAVEEDSAEPVSFRNWVVGGILLFASLAVFPLGQASGWLVRLLGSDLTFPIALTLGIVLTAYCSLFIGSHLDELAERFRLPRAG